jgi:Flp pilus assembly pilin Flp
MRNFGNYIRLFIKDRDGATMAEYGFLILLIASVCAGVVSLLGNKVAQLFVVTGL